MMKKIIPFLTIVSCILIVSCKKSYTCNCTTNTTLTVKGVPGLNSVTYQSYTNTTPYNQKMTKKQAVSACDHESQSIQSSEQKALAEGKNFNDTIKYTVLTRCFIE